MINYSLLKLDGKALEGTATSRVHQLIARLFQVNVQVSGETDVETVVVDLIDNKEICLDFTRIDNPDVSKSIGWIIQRRTAKDKFIYILYRGLHAHFPCARTRANHYGAIEYISENCVFSQTTLVDWILSNFLGNSIDQVFRWERLLDHVTADVE
jgi:hypothetical protein